MRAAMISIFTPAHQTKYLPDLYASLKAQSLQEDWEWQVLYNGDAKPIGFNDPRVIETTTDLKDGYVGALKAEVCSRAKGDILFEVDWDDLLLPTAIAEAKQAFSDPAVGFVYSNPLVVNMDWSARPRYSSANGWRYRQTEYDGRLIDEPITFEPTPASVSRIWFAPDHFRAFRRDVYEKVGGHARDMRVLDDGDLLCRMYMETKFKHIDKGLYVYRVHGENAWIKHNQEIQNNVLRLYDKYIESMACKWARDQNLKTIELGGRMFAKPGYITVDKKDADVCCDLDGDWPFADSAVGVIRAMDVFEHLKDTIHTMKEVYRVLAPGGFLFAQCPSTEGRGAWQDPSHKSYFNSNSWLYWSHQKWARFVDTPCRFQLVREYTTEKNDIDVCWTVAHLISLKNGFIAPGPINI